MRNLVILVLFVFFAHWQLCLSTFYRACSVSEFTSIICCSIRELVNTKLHNINLEYRSTLEIIITIDYTLNLVIFMIVWCNYVIYSINFKIDRISLQDLSVVVEDYFAPFIDTVTSTTAVLIIEKWELKKLDVIIL